MADAGRVSVDSKQSVLKIHERLKEEVCKIAEKKSWSAERKEEFEKKVLELYKESVEEMVQENVAVGGQEWNKISQTEEFSSAVVQLEELEPLNRDKVAEVFAVCSELEDLMKDTTFKRKDYPQQVTAGLKKILHYKKELLEKHPSTKKSDSPLNSSNLLTPDFDECIQRLQASSSEVSQLSKSFPELHSKAVRLQQVIQSHKTMQKSETDAVLFRRDNDSENVLTTSNDAGISQGDSETNEQLLNSKDFIWWGASKRHSHPPQRFDPSDYS